MVAVLGMTTAFRPRSAYAPRDVVNAPLLKTSITQRSKQRGDSADVSAWLANHWYRHLVANFYAEPPAVVRIETLEQARELFPLNPVPEWAAKRLRASSQSSPTLWWVAPQSAPLLALEAKLLEFLGSRSGTALEGKLQRVNAPQALAMWAAEHAAFEARAAAGWRSHQPDAVQVCWRGALGHFAELLPCSPKLREEMAFESQVMRHCLGQFNDRKALSGGYGEHYAAAIEGGRMRLFSYRTHTGQAHITVSANVTADGQLTVDQIKGKHNRPPIARYSEEVLQFLRTLGTAMTTPPDALAMGLVHLPSGWARASDAHQPEDQIFIAHHHPSLFAQMQQHCVAAQWLVAARDPKLLKGMPLHAPVAHALGVQP